MTKKYISSGDYKIKNKDLLDKLPCKFIYTEAKDVGLTYGDLRHFCSHGLLKSGTKDNKGVATFWKKRECVYRQKPYRTKKRL